MWTPLKGYVRGALCLCVLGLLTQSPAPGQIVPGALSLRAQFGPGFYFGEFNSFDQRGAFSPSAGFDMDFSLRYHIAENFSLLATIGYADLSYEVNDYVRQKYSANFFGPPGSATYPGSPVAFTPTNRIGVTKYILFGQSHFNASSSFVPYFTLGIGLANFSPTNDNNQDLPTNITGEYSKQAIIMPLGGGAEYFVTDRLSVSAQALVYVNSSDYLDGYAHYLEFEQTPGGIGPGLSATPSDYMASLMLGASFTIYKPDTAESPEPLASNDGEIDRSGAEEMTRPRQPLPESPALDTDQDSLTDESEVNRFMTNPLDADSDADNLSDAHEIRRENTSPNNPDTDGDSLTDGAESLVYGTNPLAADSDNDMLPDGQEVRQYRTDPLFADTDTDMAGDGVEVTRMMTDPLDPDTDGDGVIDGLDDCPTVPGDPQNRGCPPGARPNNLPVTTRTDGPLAGLPEYIEENDRVDFEGIYFRVNTDDFDFSRPETARNLGQLLSYMQQCEDLGVVIEGHTSSEGNPAWNSRLSEKRAVRVRDWLVENGVERKKLLGTLGYGSRLPKVPEPQAEAVPKSVLENIRKQNRRITALVRKPC